MRYLAAAAAAAPPESVAEGAHALEQRMLSTAQRVGYNVLFRRALPADVRTALDAQVGPAASDAAMHFARVVQALGSGRAELQPYTVGTSSAIQYGVKMTPGQSLGWFAIALQVVRFAAIAAASAAGYELLDGWTETKKVEADAELVRARTDAAVAESAKQLQATDPKAAMSLLSLASTARATAESGSQSLNWLETAGTAAMGVGTGLLLAAGAYFLLKRSGGKRRKNPRRRGAALLGALAAAAVAENKVTPGGTWSGGPMYVETGYPDTAKLLLALGVLLAYGRRRHAR